MRVGDRLMGFTGSVLVALCVLPSTALAAEAAALFQVQVEVRRVDEGQGAVAEDTSRTELARSTASLREELDLGLSLDVGARMQPLRRTLRPRYSWKRSLVHTLDSATAREESGEESGTRLVDWEVTLERNFQPIACEGVWVRDRVVDAHDRVRTVEPDPGPGSQGVRLRLSATWPGKVRLRDPQEGLAPFEAETLPALDVDVVLPYDPGSPGQRSRLAFVSRSPATELAPAAERTWYVGVDLAPAEPHEFGLSARVQPDGTLALLSRVVVGGRDLAPASQVRRVQRTWAVREEAGRPGYELVSDWRVVAENGGRPASQHLFFDPVNPSTWPDRRWLVEVLETVEGLPELGLLYHQVWTETRRAGARFHVSATEARAISPSTWCEVKRSGTPATDAPQLVGGGPLKILAESTYDAGGLATR